MEKLLCFVAVNFMNDPIVAGYPFWYYSQFRDAEVGDHVIAPLGRHNTPQEGIIMEVRFRTEDRAPYPFDKIKRIWELRKEKENV